MKTKSVFKILILLTFVTPNIFAQNLPAKIKSYLDRNYKGWVLTKDKCSGSGGKVVVSGNFNGDSKVDYAVKFTSKGKGYIFAFLNRNRNYKAFVLHNNLSAKETVSLSLDIWKKGEMFESEGGSFHLKNDAPSDYFCESDVGGIHYFRKGKFVGY